MQDKAIPTVAIRKDQKYSPAYRLKVPQMMQRSSRTLYRASERKTIMMVKSVQSMPSTPVPKLRGRITGAILTRRRSDADQSKHERDHEKILLVIACLLSPCMTHFDESYGVVILSVGDEREAATTASRDRPYHLLLYFTASFLNPNPNHCIGMKCGKSVLDETLFPRLAILDEAEDY